MIEIKPHTNSCIDCKYVKVSRLKYYYCTNGAGKILFYDDVSNEPYYSTESRASDYRSQNCKGNFFERKQTLKQRIKQLFKGVK